MKEASEAPTTCKDKHGNGYRDIIVFKPFAVLFVIFVFGMFHSKNHYNLTKNFQVSQLELSMKIVQQRPGNYNPQQKLLEEVLIRQSARLRSRLGNNQSFQEINTRIFFSVPDDILNDAYSGMWWMKASLFQTIEAENMRNLESATFASIREKPIKMTRNLLDFAVEHLSIFFRDLYLDEYPYAFQVGSQALENYTDRVLAGALEQRQEQRFDKSTISRVASPANDVINSTIAIVPFGLKSTVDAEDSAMGNSHRIRMLSLEATLASLWQIGIGRAVVVGNSKQERKCVNSLFEEFRLKQRRFQYNNNTQHVMELEFVNIGVESNLNFVNLPKHAIQRLQRAMKGEADEADALQWLGNDSNRWKHVYFTEPDLILHTKPELLPMIARELRRGSVLAAHRLLLIHHESDFPRIPNKSLIIPAVGKFKDVVTLDTAKGDACLDTAILEQYRIIEKPNKVFPKCDYGHRWWRCGYEDPSVNYTDTKSVSRAFYRIDPYTPLIRLRQGTGFVLISGSHHGRPCTVRLAKS